MRTIYLFLILTITSCHSPLIIPHDIRIVLEKAGSNKDQLLKVIHHYQHDSLKLKAAYYLIKNIDGLTTLDSNSVNHDLYFNALNTTYNKDHVKLEWSVISKVIDSLNETNQLYHPASNPSYLNELQIITADFLIRNIDDAFYAWQHMPWAKDISFDTFCEYILPYRCTDTYAPTARSYLYTRYKPLATLNNAFKIGNYIDKDIDSWFTENSAIFSNYPYLYPIQFSDLLKARIGVCTDATSLRITAMRAMAIPTAMDEIPNWGNLNSSHFWYRIIDTAHDTIAHLITNENVFRNTQYLITGSSYDLFPVYKGIPPDVELHYVRTVPKVYRKSFSKQLNSLSAIKNTTDEIPQFFENDRLKDVTTTYLETADITIELKKTQPHQKFIYLCVFDNENWQPVSWAQIKGNTATFQSTGKNIVYLPAYYNHGQIIPADNPFLLTPQGEMKEIKPGNKKEIIKLHTKYPYRNFVQNWHSLMIGARFQGCNKADLSDTITMYTIKQLPFYQQEINTNCKQPFRYLIFQFQGLPEVNVGEIEYYSSDERVRGKLIGNKGIYSNPASKIDDDDRLTFFAANKTDPSYIAMDLGEHNTKIVTSIKFIARNDGNEILKNHSYELFQWNNNKWESLGIKKSLQENMITFNSIPQGTLLLLTDKSGGTENRIFTYENGKQIFW